MLACIAYGSEMNRYEARLDQRRGLPAAEVLVELELHAGFACGSYASIQAAPWAVDRSALDRFLWIVENAWDAGVLVPINAPSRRGDKAFVEWFARLERAAASPGAILDLLRATTRSTFATCCPRSRPRR